MSNIVRMSTHPKSSASQAFDGLRVSTIRTTADYRRLLSEMRQRPLSQRMFLRKFLQRAAMTGVPIVFPVHHHVVLTP